MQKSRNASIACGPYLFSTCTSLSTFTVFLSSSVVFNSIHLLTKRLHRSKLQANTSSSEAKPDAARSVITVDFVWMYLLLKVFAQTFRGSSEPLWALTCAGQHLSTSASLCRFTGWAEISSFIICYLFACSYVCITECSLQNKSCNFVKACTYFNYSCVIKLSDGIMSFDWKWKNKHFYSLY